MNLFVDADLVDEARRLRINMSETLERRLRVMIKAERERRWLEDNRGAIESINRMNPSFVISDAQYWLATHELFAIEQRMLKARIANLAEHRDTIMNALDFVLTGY